MKFFWIKFFFGVHFPCNFFFPTDYFADELLFRWTKLMSKNFSFLTYYIHELFRPTNFFDEFFSTNFFGRTFYFRLNYFDCVFAMIFFDELFWWIISCTNFLLLFFRGIFFEVIFWPTLSTILIFDKHFGRNVLTNYFWGTILFRRNLKLSLLDKCFFPDEHLFEELFLSDEMFFPTNFSQQIFLPSNFFRRNLFLKLYFNQLFLTF